MATAALVHQPAIQTAPAAAIPAWWWRRHSYVLAAVAAGEIALTWGVVRLAENFPDWSPGWQEVANSAMLGWLLAECFLLGLWAALGGLSTVPRWLIVGTVCLLGSLAVAVEVFQPDWQTFWSNAPEIALMGAIAAASLAALLLPLRRLAGWRIDFDAAYHPRTACRRGQIELMDFAAMMCAVALPLTLGRLLLELEGENDTGVLLLVPIFSGVAFLAAAPAAWAVLARRRTWLCLVATAIWIIACSWSHSLLAANVPALDIFDGQSGGWGLSPTIAAYYAGSALAVALPLGLLRLVGLKLIVVT